MQTAEQIRRETERRFCLPFLNVFRPFIEKKGKKWQSFQGKALLVYLGQEKKSISNPIIRKKCSPKSHFPGIFSIKACATMENMPFFKLEYPVRR